jgi:hypothetical protein
MVSLVSAALGAVLAGCAEKGSGGGGMAADSGEGESSDGESGDGTGGDGDGDGCGGYEDQYGPALAVTIQNDRAEVAYVAVQGQCDTGVLWVTSDEGLSLPGLSDCWTCAGAIAGPCACPGPPCQFFTALKLEPGASYEASASATIYVGDELPAQCASFDCPTACQRAEPWPDGPYTAHVQVGAAVLCQEGTCDCDASGSGYCFIEGQGALDGTPTEQTGPLSLPAETATTIVIPP